MKIRVAFVIAFGLVCVFSGVSQADLNDGLVAYYPFNGNADDESGNGNDGQLMPVGDGPILCKDKEGNPDSAYKFDGQNDYVDCGNDTSLRITDTVTISAWVRLDAFSSKNQGIVSKWDGLSSQRAYDLLINNQLSSCGPDVRHAPSLYLSSNGDCTTGCSSYCSSLSGMTALSLGKWHHVVGIFVPSTSLSIYIDGTLDSSTESSVISILYDSTSNLLIGNQYSTESSDYYFDGAIDDVRIYNRALTADEIYMLAERLPCSGDLDGDGDVDSSDLALFSDDYGRHNCEMELIGTWIGDEVDGLAGNWAIVFHCNHLDVVGPEEWYRGTFTLNKANDPYELDFMIAESGNPDNNGKTSLAIYEISGGTLTLAFGQPGSPERPADFTPVADEVRVFVLGR